jgi:GAF domain-containing protein
VYDQPLFLQTLSKFAGALPAQYDIDEVLSELADSVAAVLGLSGSGVSLAEDGRLRFVTAVSDASGDLERIQEQSQAGPCKEAYDTGDVVRVNDVRQASDRWPAFSTAARRLGVARVAGIPMRLAEQSIGALDIYAAEPRTWSDEDIAVARVLADMATGYVVSTSKLRQQEQLNEQLQQALDSRVVIEQAKGITAHHRGVTVDQAFQLMRRHARNHNASMRSVACAIVHLGLRV